MAVLLLVTDGVLLVDAVGERVLVTVVLAVGVNDIERVRLGGGVPAIQTPHTLCAYY